MKKVALLAVFLSTPSFSVTSLVFNGVTGRNSNAVRNFDLSVVRHLKYSLLYDDLNIVLSGYPFALFNGIG